MSPSLKPSSPSFSGSKSYSARQQGWSMGAGEKRNVGEKRRVRREAGRGDMMLHINEKHNDHNKSL